MALRISKDRVITIPQHLLDECELRPDDEIEITATSAGLLIRKLAAEKDPIERAYGIWGLGVSTDEYMKDIRGR